MKREGYRPIHYPMFLKIVGKKSVVVGGGEVAARKVKTLLEYGANVEVISPAASPVLCELAKVGRIHILKREYQLGDLKGAFVAIAATDNNQINQLVVKEARDNEILVNVVDDLENSDFICPAYIRQEQITIAISTDGTSPALAGKMRAKLEEDFGDYYASLGNLISEIRRDVRQRGLKFDGSDWREALDLDLLLELLKQGKTEKAKTILMSSLNKREAT